ncbi:hypothetical protein HDV00_005281 [Rhizophlyctis rosea]|nr:hypothetical protein HDV00_005281 [Rhizophlyctis rosea]
MPFSPSAPVSIPTSLPATEMFARSPSPPRAAGSGLSFEQLPEVQMMMTQMQDRPAGVHSAKPKKSILKAVGPAKKVVKEQRGVRHVQFREFVIVAHTHSPDDYDRSSLQVSPLTQEDVTTLLAYRAEMHATTSALVRIRQQAIDEQIRLKRQQQHQRQQELAAFQFYHAAAAATTTVSKAASAAETTYSAWDQQAAYVPIQPPYVSSNYTPHPYMTSPYGMSSFHHPSPLGQAWRMPAVYH